MDLEWDISPVTGVLIQRELTGRHARKKGQERKEAKTGVMGTTRQRTELEDARKDPPIEASESPWSCRHLTLDLQPPELRDNRFLLF